MKALITFDNLASNLVSTIWTPLFVGIFIAIVAWALWPRNKAKFDAASMLPLRVE
jgi:cytochrome c oxidase cbb3-type subunit 4